MNKNIWNLYKNSERGKEIIALFANLRKERFDNFFKKYNEYLGDVEEKYFFGYLYLIIDNLCADKLYLNDNESAKDYFVRLIDSIEICPIEDNVQGDFVKIKNEPPLVAQGDYKTLCAILPEISLVLYIYGELFFFPMLFREQFDVFMKTLDVLEIPMPELPSKSDKKGRLLLYNELNDSIVKFAKENDFTEEETCACIYDFALLLLDDNKNETEMPKPTNIWLTGGSKEDYETILKNPINDGIKEAWTCNENTKRGDIIVMYVRTPYSCIQSIWRADIDGTYTPFGYYNSRARVTNGIVLPHIGINELKNDPYFSQLPIVRKNLQGVNGVQFSATDYKELQRLLKNKGFDISVLPQLYAPNLEIAGQIKNEKDVEEKLLIPMLKKLGYSELDWTRQLSQKAGRKEKAIPDFVFFPKGEVHFQNAPMIVEAKYDMNSNLERTKAYNQALSYARLMKSPIFGICDKDRMIIYKEKSSNFDRFNPTFEKHWQSINDAEVFRRLKLLIGKDAIEK